jgi:hypothetical protein
MLQAFCCAAFLVVASGGLSAAPPDSRGDLFSSYSPVEVTLHAPFEDLFAKAQQDAEYAVKGRLTYVDAATGDEVAIDGVEFSVRGQTSKRETECSFPKLKLRFTDDDAVAPSIFRGMKAVKIGTHCGDQPDDQLTQRFGRWANEAFIYRLLDVLQVRSFKARPARITYVDRQQRTARNAMLLEDDREAMKRFGASREIEPAEFRDAERDFAVEDTAKLAFAEALVGNFDWCLRFFAGDTYRCDARQPLWNILAFAPRDGRAFPVAYDFDLAGMVVGRHAWFSRVFWEGFLESKSMPAIEAFSQVQHTRALFPRRVLDATRRAFAARKAQAFAALEDATLDDGGRSTISMYMKAFFDAIESDERFYAPVVMRPNERIYLDARKSQPACGAASEAPVGTLVGPPRRTDGDMIEVAILDVQWKWATPARCDAVHRGPVWIDRNAIGTDYPAR